MTITPLMSPDATRFGRRDDRQGLTLIELLLVVAIMVVVAAMAAPSVRRTLTRITLQKGADRVRVAMGQARVKAIREGEEYAVFYRPGGAWFNVAPFSSHNDQSTKAARRERNVENGTQTNFDDDLLPTGVRFGAAETSMNSRDADVLANGGSDSAIRLILFYPDGTSQDAKITLQNENREMIEVQLRGLTGNAKTVRVEQTETN